MKTFVRNRWKLVFTTIAVVTALLTGCAQLALATNSPMFQRFEFGNDGVGMIRGVKIRYGQVTIPAGTAAEDYVPNHMVINSEAGELPVPEVASARWLSDDGKEHVVSLPIRELVKSPRCFHGFRFFFVDDHLDLYVLNRVGDCSYSVQASMVIRTKVYAAK